MGPELVIAGWFAAPVVRDLIDYISKLPVWLREKNELRKLKSALQRIKAVVETVENLQIIDDGTPELKAWLWQLKDAMEVASNVLDELEYYRLEERVKNGGEKVHAFVSKYAPFLSKHKTGLKNKMNRAVKKIDEVAAHQGHFLHLLSLSNAHGPRLQQFVDRNSGHLLTEDKVFGREEEREHIVAWLKKSAGSEHESGVKNVTVLPIVGAGGIGKTTLAQLVYEDVEKHFELRMWVCVSNNFDVTDIMKKIVVAATDDNPPNEEWSTLQKILTKNLQSKRFLLVLDDVWNDNERQEWENLMAPLKKGKQGSKILLTTRMNSVAKMIHNVMEGTEEPMNLQGVEWDDYLLLFNKHAFAGVNPDDHETLQSVGCEIAEKLGRSPLAAKVVGGMLNSQLSVESWKKVLEDGVFNSIRDHKDFKPVLRLSYLNLSPNLQSCFRFCSIFPQDYQFEKDDLIYMWMAAGLIRQSEDVNARLEDIGGKYFDNLLQKSFFNRHPDLLIERYTIHDLLHEVACSVSKDECLGVFSKEEARDFQFSTTLRHLFIKVEDPALLEKISQIENLQTLVLWVVGYDHRSDDILHKVVKGLKNLRVLKLKRHIVKLKSFNAFSHLKHLRYLKLKLFTTDIILLSKAVSKLYHLQTLSSPSHWGMVSTINRGCESNICEGINSLINLRHVHLPDFRDIKKPEISLQELYTFNVKAKKGCKIGMLKHMTGLHGSLCIQNLENVRSYDDATEAELHNKVYLHKLLLQWNPDSNCSPEVAEEVLDGLEPSRTIEDLEIIGYGGARPPRWLETKDYLTKLKSITLCDCRALNVLPPIEQLPFLESLSLRNLSALTQIDHPLPKYGVHLASLSELYLEGCTNIASLPSVEVFRRFVALDYLRISRCTKLASLGGLQALLSIRFLKIKGCPKLVEAAAAMPPLTSDAGKGIADGSSFSLNELKIDDPSLLLLEPLRSVTSVHCVRMDLVNCSRLTSLTDEWLLQVHTSLKTLELYNKDSLVFLPVSLKRLSSLQYLILDENPLLQSLPELPTSLEILLIGDCDPELKDRIRKKNGQDWNRIAHIRQVCIDFEFVKE